MSLRHRPSPLLRVEEPERVVADDAFVVLPIGGAPEGGEGDFNVIDFVLGRGGRGHRTSPGPLPASLPA